MACYPKPQFSQCFGKRWKGMGRATRGVYTEAGSYFWHPEKRKLYRQMAAMGGAARLGMDDLFLIGSPDILFPAMEEF